MEGEKAKQQWDLRQSSEEGGLILNPQGTLNVSCASELVPT